jgi:hypothetical protein
LTGKLNPAAMLFRDYISFRKSANNRPALRLAFRHGDPKIGSVCIHAAGMIQRDNGFSPSKGVMRQTSQLVREDQVRKSKACRGFVSSRRAVT